jgi:hypothetical protein
MKSSCSAGRASQAVFHDRAVPLVASRSIGVNFQPMRIFASLATLAYLAVMFAFVGAAVGFFAGFVGVLLFGVDLTHLPLFGTGGAVGFALWAFPRVCGSNAGETMVVDALQRDDIWTADSFMEDCPMAFDQTLGCLDAVTSVESSAAPDPFDTPRMMIDGFTFGDNLYEVIHET